MQIPKSTKGITEVVGSDKYGYKIISHRGREIDIVDINQRVGRPIKVITLRFRYGKWWQLSKEDHELKSGPYVRSWEIELGINDYRDPSF